MHPGPAEEKLVRLGEGALAHERRDHREPDGLGELAKLPGRVAVQRPAPDVEDRLVGRRDRGRGLLDLARVTPLRRLPARELDLGGVVEVDLRLLDVGPLTKVKQEGWDLKKLVGGLIVQDRDLGVLSNIKTLSVPTVRKPTEEEYRAAGFAWIVCKHVKSNAIVYARSGQTVGIGAGQMSRVDSVKLAGMKAQLPVKGCVMASDAFFPFRDGLDAAAQAGISCVIQPGGSIRDSEVIKAADEQGLAMILTGMRHFRH